MLCKVKSKNSSLFEGFGIKNRPFTCPAFRFLFRLPGDNRLESFGGKTPGTLTELTIP